MISPEIAKWNLISIPLQPVPSKTIARPVQSPHPGIMLTLLDSKHCGAANAESMDHFDTKRQIAFCSLLRAPRRASMHKNERAPPARVADGKSCASFFTATLACLVELRVAQVAT